MFHHHDETNGPYQRKVNKSMDNIPIRPLIKKCAFNSEQMEAVAEAGGWIERSADTSALQSRLRVLSWSMSTALMECIKLSSDDAERTTPVYRGRRNKEIKAPPPSEDGAHVHPTSAVSDLVRHYYANMWLRYAFLFLSLRHFDEGLYRWLIR